METSAITGIQPAWPGLADVHKRNNGIGY